MFLGILLLVFYTVSLFKGGSFKEFFSEAKKFENVKEEDFANDSEMVETSIKFVIKALGILLVLIALAFGQLFFFIGAFSVDFLIFPTLIMLVWYVGGFIYKLVSKKSKEKSKNVDMTKTNPKQQISRVIYIVYILFILALIII